MSKKVSKDRIKNIISLIENKKWEDAEKTLFKLQKTNDGQVLFLLGILFNEWGNPNKDKNKAKEFFNLSAESDNCPPNTFIQLARLETNRVHSIRILKKGLKFFPNSEQIYCSLINYSEASDREPIYFNADEKGCLSERIKIRMSETYFRLSNYEKCLKMLAVIQTDNDTDTEILKCMEGFCLYEIGKSKKAENIFKKLVENDINHKLEYVPTFGLILALTNENNISEAEKVVGELPLDINIETFIGGPGGEAYFDAEKHRLKAINELLKKTKSKDVKGRLRGTRGLFTYSQAYEMEETSKAAKLAVKRDFEFAQKIFPSEMKYVEQLFWISNFRLGSCM